VSPFLIFILRKNMYGNKDKGTTDDSSIPVDIKLWKEALVEAMKWIMRGGGELEHLHERFKWRMHARSSHN
jgi:hypothetical protein